MALEQPPTGADSDRYEVRRKLGTGELGFGLPGARSRNGRAARAQAVASDRRPQRIARLKREFRSLANMNHRNVIEPVRPGRARDGWFLTMEYVDGNDLCVTSVAARASRKLSSEALRGQVSTPADLERILSAFHQLASGMHALHRAHVLHRDLKPSNVLVADGRVVVRGLRPRRSKSARKSTG